MKIRRLLRVLCLLPGAFAPQVFAQVQAPFARPDIPVSNADRVYAADQTSNTVSVIDPFNNQLLGVIRLGNPVPGALSPLYTGQLLVHGMGYSPDYKTVAVVSVASNSVTLIDTETNAVKGTIYVGRSPHEAFFMPDGSELWVTVRGEDYVYVIDVASDQIVKRLPQASPFCPNIAVSPENDEVWFTLKDTGQVQVYSAQPPFGLKATLQTGPITNHVNFANNKNGKFAYVTIGGANEVKVFRRGATPQL